MDFIVINGGAEPINVDRIDSCSSLIALDASPEQTSVCSPPADMSNTRMGHMIRIVNGSMVVCGGSILPSVTNDECLVYNKDLTVWEPGVQKLNQSKAYFPYVQLDDNRIWIGCKFSEIMVLTKVENK